MFCNKKTKFQKKPNHIGFILDGNRRWAKERGLPVNFGHKAGVEAILKTVKALLKFEIPHASIFAFSTENWKREKSEIDGIFNLVREMFENQSSVFEENEVKVNIFGDLKDFPKDMQEILENIVEKTQNNTKLVFNICLNYGGRADIVRAVNDLIEKGNKSVSEEDIKNNLYSKNQPDLDLVIRTSGEQRISNFMIFQLAYAELYFPKIYWPDFDEKELVKSLKIFEKRNRRFGGL